MSNTTGLVQFQELPAIAANAPQILKKNTELLDRALAKGQTLIDTIEGGDMSPELDDECNRYLAQCAKALSIMNEGRAPITKMQ